ncbi:hypothetical protein [Micromonospora sp. NBC_01796]|uniref:hypothetical protein n=1 Tax=Micromonospora sp. NBC_01796 TaxID=2975987 RepID=UPI002DDBFF92|nr:hypothetical protein [Micromonospora sp. NBC_01796]WSA88665.1 hypothetical protein OIE47_14265 [Micromonospora sp. NBC_01796]
MEYEKGDKVVLTKLVDGHKPGAAGLVIRVETGWLSRTRYDVLVGDTGEVLEQLVEDDLFSPERDSAT